MMQVLQRVGFAAMLVLGAAAGNSVLADDDSSADARNGFARTVATSEAVVLRVPINERGEELTSAASMRLHSGEALTNGAGIKAAYERGMDLSGQPQVSSADIERDTSTYGWNRWGYRGWYSNYYYNYRPYYYNYGYYYNYSNPYYYNYYYPSSNYWGYRYYYYPRYW